MFPEECEGCGDEYFYLLGGLCRMCIRRSALGGYLYPGFLTERSTRMEEAAKECVTLFEENLRRWATFEERHGPAHIE